MLESSNVLAYEPPRANRVRWFHAWTLPLLWLPGSALSIIFYGDEYSGLAAAHLPALPLAELFAAPLGMTPVIILCVGVCASLVCGGGILMDVMRVPRWLQLPALAWFAFVNLALAAYREWSIYGLGPAWCSTIYLLIALSITGYAVALLVKRVWRAMRTGE